MYTCTYVGIAGVVIALSKCAVIGGVVDNTGNGTTRLQIHGSEYPPGQNGALHDKGEDGEEKGRQGIPHCSVKSAMSFTLFSNLSWC